MAWTSDVPKSTNQVGNDLTAMNDNFDLLQPATTAEVKAGTATDRTVSPATLIGHEGVIKGWVSFDGTGAVGAITPNGSFNVTSVTKNSSGDYTVTWATDFGGITYCPWASSNNFHTSVAKELAAGTITVRTYGNAHTAGDADLVTVIAIGDR